MVDKITRWLHLSDLHLLLDDDRDITMTTLQENYSTFFKNYRDKHNIGNDTPLFDFVVITGDLHDSSGHSKKNKEYGQSISFLESFIEGELKVTKENVFMVPGNHDAVYPKKEKHISTISQILHKKNSIKPEKPERANFENYANFINNYYCEDCPNRDKESCKGYECEKNKYKKWIKNNFKGEYIVKWSERIGNDIGSSMSILHLNTASWHGEKRPASDKDSNGNFYSGDIIIDLEHDDPTKTTVYRGAPVIAIGHNPYQHFNSMSQGWMTAVINNNDISAYLCGDVHRRDIFSIRGTDIKSICCSKLSSDKRDGWSDFGFIIYEWNHNDFDPNNAEINTDGKVTVYPYSWHISVTKNNDGTNNVEPATCGIQPSHDFRQPNDEREFEFRLKQHGHPKGHDKLDQYIIGNGNYNSIGNYKDNFEKIINVLKDSVTVNDSNNEPLPLNWLLAT